MFYSGVYLGVCEVNYDNGHNFMFKGCVDFAWIKVYCCGWLYINAEIYFTWMFYWTEIYKIQSIVLFSIVNCICLLIK